MKVPERFGQYNETFDLFRVWWSVDRTKDKFTNLHLYWVSSISGLELPCLLIFTLLYNKQTGTCT